VAEAVFVKEHSLPIKRKGLSSAAILYSNICGKGRSVCITQSVVDTDQIGSGFDPDQDVRVIVPDVDPETYLLK
jgi:hypothetical protein